jgi:hypothetical protein
VRYCYNWRRQTDKLQAAARILTSHDFQDMMATLELDHPARSNLSVVDGLQGMKLLGVIEGYQRCLDLIRSLGTPVKDIGKPDVESTFGTKSE